MDNKLIGLINKKKLEGYKYLFDCYYPSLCSYSSRFLNYKSDSEDIVQDVFLRLWKSKAKFNSTTALSSYLYNSVKNACLNAIRNNSKMSDISIDEIKDNNILKIDDKSVEQIIIEEEYYRQIYVTINKISPQRKNIILLSMEGFTNKEIANKTGVSINTVKTLKLKAYRFLKEELKLVLFVFLFYLLGF